MKPSRIAVTCPRCGHVQEEPAAAYSTRCRDCGEHFRLEDVVRPAPGRWADSTPRPGAPGTRRVACFQCGTVLEVSPSAQSTMCKRCSSHVDLRDYDINHTESKNFRTRGRFVLQEGGCLLNTDSVMQDAVIKGKVIGRIQALGSLELHRQAEIRGSFKAGLLVITDETVFRWAEPIVVGGADIAGEVQGTLVASGTVTLRAGSRFFGKIEAGSLRVFSGAILVAGVRVGVPASPNDSHPPEAGAPAVSPRPSNLPSRPPSQPG
ncbi:MAG: hypothetical protein RJA22_1383 [Verrucomicrobiota bacterium]